jgi:hypothetical protein
VWGKKSRGECPRKSYLVAALRLSSVAHENGLGGGFLELEKDGVLLGHELVDFGGQDLHVAERYTESGNKVSDGSSTDFARGCAGM